MSPSDFVSAKIKAKWDRLEQIGKRQELFLKTLKHFETQLRPGVSLYEDIMKDLTEEKMLPVLRKQQSCSACLAIPIPK